MKKFVYCGVLLSMLSCLSAAQKERTITMNPSFYGLNDKLLDEWKKDTNGCLRLRAKYMDTIQNNKKLMGVSKNTILTLFGKPNAKSTYVYDYDLAGVCNNMGINKDLDFCNIVFVFNESKKVDLIVIQCK